MLAQSISSPFGHFDLFGFVPAPQVAAFDAFLIDLTAIVIVAFGVFYRRQRRADLLLSFMLLNVALFAIGVLLVNQMHVGVAFGFGLFAILSIIRLRSEQISPEESAYYFVALALGLINGMQFHNSQLCVLLNMLLVGVVVIVDNRWVLPSTKRQMVTLDIVHPDEESLRRDLADRLGAKILKVYVRQTDYVREITSVDVRYKPLRPGRAWSSRVPTAVPTRLPVRRRSDLVGLTADRDTTATR